MSLLFADSFDHYQTTNILSKWTTTSVRGPGTGSFVIPGAGRCGTQALYLTAIANVFKGISFGAPTKGFAGFAVNVTLASLGLPMFGVIGSGGVYEWYADYRPDGSITIQQGATNALIATTPPDVVRANSFAYVEFGWLLSSTVGTVTVRVNGAQVLAATGLNTHNPANGAAAGTAISLGCSNNANLYFDDLYVCDDVDDGLTPATNTFLGDVRVEYREPTANGAHQDFALVGAATHWQAVDDGATPDGDSSYIWSATSGHIDTEIYQGTGLPSGNIYGVQVSPYVRKTDSGARLIASVVRSSGGVDAVGADKAPSTVYEYLHHMFQRDPNTGLGWTIANFNASQYGVKVTS